MIISPPFLPPRQPDETDEAYVRRAMSGGAAGDGGFPISFELNWHGGFHLPVPAGADATVRAIADGVIAFVRAATPATAANLSNSQHPLNYRGGWTDDGCVVIRHTTKIGTGDEITYFSIYMHLQQVAEGVVSGQRIFRKLPLGTAGRIYGQANRIHHQIVCDDNNVARLAGRTEPFNSVRDGNGAVQHGRIDAVFGAMWFFVFVDTPFFDRDPGLPVPPGAAAPAIIHRNAEAHPIRMELRAGACVLRTHHLDGRPLGAEQIEADYEYEMFKTAQTRFTGATAAGYEVLRFGRVLGPDVLTPANAPNWRRVTFDGGVGFVDLNAPTVARLSDADMPFWDKGWILVDGSSNADSRCQEPRIRTLLDANRDWSLTPEEVQNSLNDPDVQERLSRKICKFRTEWDPGDLDARYGWLRTDSRIKMTDADFTRFKAHVSALAFWNTSIGFPATPWHFHPRSFVRHFRQCGWMTADELTQLLPRQPDPPFNARNRISFAEASRRFTPFVDSLNTVFRRYNILDANRQIHFLAQTYIETALWRTMREFGRARPRRDGTFPVRTMEFYAAFYGRGIMQLTWASNYDGYGNFRGLPRVAAGVTYGDDRITATSLHDWGPPAAAGTRDRRRWSPRYDPEIVADDAFAACDSGGYYWVSKEVGGPATNRRHSINRTCDQGVSTATVGRVSVLVNGGGFGFAERQRYAAYISRYRSDDTNTARNEILSVVRGGTTLDVEVDYTAQRP